MFGDLLSAGTRLLGGLLDRNTASENRAAQERMAANNIALQREFAQSGIQWRVADAQAAGVHPLFALGANTTSFSPVSVGSTSSPSMADTLGAAGQDIGRAINATQNHEQRAAAKAAQVGTALELEKKGLENEILKTQLASGQSRLKQQQNPAMPTDGTIPVSKKIEEAPNLMFDQKKLALDLGFSNAEDFEKRWGEYGGDMTGLYIMARDIMHHNKDWNLTRETRDNWLRKIGRGLNWIDRNTRIY